MLLPKQKAGQGSSAPRMTQTELHARILAVVNERQHVSDAEIWRADTNNLLPWQLMQQALIGLHQAGQLRREVIAPGHIVIHAIKRGAEKAPKPKKKTAPGKKNGKRTPALSPRKTRRACGNPA